MVPTVKWAKQKASKRELIIICPQKNMAQLQKQRAPVWHQKVHNGRFANDNWGLGRVH